MDIDLTMLTDEELSQLMLRVTEESTRRSARANSERQITSAIKQAQNNGLDPAEINAMVALANQPKETNGTDA